MTTAVLVVLIMLIFLMIPIWIHRERKVTTDYQVATHMALTTKLDVYFRENEFCKHTFPQVKPGGLVCITNQRIIHRHSSNFTLLFSADYENISKLERQGTKITITLLNGRKQVINLYKQDALRLFELLTMEYIRRGERK